MSAFCFLQQSARSFIPVALDERKSKLRLAAPLPGKKAKYVRDAMVTLFSSIKQFVKTVTFDNGKEFTLHENIAKEIGCDTYFSKPYHSWERGQNENANGLLRQYFPKSIELVDISMKQVLEAIDKLNNRPRKYLKCGLARSTVPAAILAPASFHILHTPQLPDTEPGKTQDNKEHCKKSIPAIFRVGITRKH